MTSTSIHDDLRRVYGHDAPSYCTVADWAARFRDGRESVEGDQRSGRPVSTCTPENIERVRKLIEDDARIMNYGGGYCYFVGHLIGKFSDHLEGASSNEKALRNMGATHSHRGTERGTSGSGFISSSEV